jgi:hypothetical protein
MIANSEVMFDTHFALKAMLLDLLSLRWTKPNAI